MGGTLERRAVAAASRGSRWRGLSTVPRRRLAAMRAAARDLLAVLEDFTRQGRHPVRDLLATASGTCTRWQHYPPDDVEDPATGYAWYYHAHDPSAARQWHEHGHFHCYAYTELVPASAPITLPADPDYS